MKKQEKKQIIQTGNLKHNWYFPFLSVAYFYLMGSNYLIYYVGFLFAFCLMVSIAEKAEPFWAIIKSQSVGMNIFCGASAIGSCFGILTAYKRGIRDYFPLGESGFAIAIFNGIAMIAATFFIFIWISCFWKELIAIFKEKGIFSETSKIERITYTVMLMVMIIVVAVVFLQTDAFYGTNINFDVIYTSDSPIQMKGNVYLLLTHQENDLRQPLFAIFSTPFVGVSYLLGAITGNSPAWKAIFVNSVQIAVLYAANIILANIIKIDQKKRICFVILMNCTYMSLLFTMMIEQYIFAYFYLMLCLYLILEKHKSAKRAIWGAGGTLLTSMALIPFVSARSPIKELKSWLKETVFCGIGFLRLMLAFCRLDVLVYIIAKAKYLGQFTGKNVPIQEKLFQFTEFVHSCFIAPNAGKTMIEAGNITFFAWRMTPAAGINIIGMIILALAIISAIVNRKNKSSLLAAGWVGLSVIMLFVLGWGTQENGLILYSLYFGWAFFVLIFQLVEKIEDKLNMKFLVPVFSVACAATLAVVNIPAILEMVNFAITYFPV